MVRHAQPNLPFADDDVVGAEGNEVRGFFVRVGTGDDQQARVGIAGLFDPLAGFERVVQTCYVPVVVLGGKRKDDPRTTFNMLRASLDAGGAGAVIGRNIWQSPHPKRMAAALTAMIHQNINVDEAMEMLIG